MRVAPGYAAIALLAGFLQPGYPVIKVSGEPPHWKLDSLATIVSPDGVGFSQVGSVLIDPRGGVLVVDRKEKVIYRFDDRGKVLGTIGRVGSGPSEFRVPYALGWLGDELMVFDPNNGRILRWSRDARFLGQWPLTARLGGQLQPFAAANNTLWLRQGGIGPTGKYQSNYVRFPQSGRNDTIWWPYREPSATRGIPEGKDGYVVCADSNGSFWWFHSPFTEVVPRQVVTWEGKLLETAGLDYRLVLLNKPGDTAKVIERAMTRVPVSDAEWKEGLTEYDTYKREYREAKCTGRQVRPATKPAIRDLATDDVGRVWVERYMRSGFQWEAWKGDKMVGAFTMPDSDPNSGTAFGGGRVAFVRYRVADGGFEVRLYRIRQ